MVMFYNILSLKVAPVSLTSCNMSEEQLTQLTRSITNTIDTKIESKVNGSIRRLDEKMDNYIILDIDWKKNKVEPLIDAHKTIQNLATFIKWAASIAVAITVLLKLNAAEDFISKIK